MGSYIGPHNTQYQYLLFDFLEQANRFTKTQTMTDNRRQFLKSWQENEEKINNIYANCDQMWGEMKRKAKNHYTQCLEKLTEPEKQVFKAWLWNPRKKNVYDAYWSAVFDLEGVDNIDGFKIHFDIAFHPLRVSHYLGLRPRSQDGRLDVIASRINNNCDGAFNDYSKHPSNTSMIV